MEIEATYIAKDGMRFKDPLECESYEKKLGTLKGSVGELINYLKEMDSKLYTYAIVCVREENVNSIHTFCTLNVDSYIDTFVNVSDLAEEQRYIMSTVGSIIESLNKLDKDLPCQYMISTSPKIDFSSGIVMMANHNDKVWEKRARKI